MKTRRFGADNRQWLVDTELIKQEMCLISTTTAGVSVRTIRTGAASQGMVGLGETATPRYPYLDRIILLLDVLSDQSEKYEGVPGDVRRWYRVSTSPLSIKTTCTCSSYTTVCINPCCRTQVLFGRASERERIRIRKLYFTRIVV